MNEATQPGASVAQPPAAPPPAIPGTPQERTPERAPNPRDAIIDGVEDQITADRQQTQKEYLEEVGGELGMSPPPVEPDPDGAQKTEPMHPPAEPAALPAELASHEMAQYIEMHNGQPMMRAKVNGADTLIPMDRVQSQLQKHEAAEVSMQNAAEMHKQLAFREEQIRKNEAALNQRMQTLATPPPVQPGVDDETLLGEAKAIVSTLFTGDEDAAAGKLANVLKRSTVPAQVVAPPIDTTQIANEAARVAVQAMTQRDLNVDAQAGLEQFGKDYPELMADPNLYNIADGMTDVIERENPSWKPSEIMLEAGKRTSAWLNEQKGVAPPGALPPQPSAGNDPTRQERKDGLVRIPQPALGAQLAPEGEEAAPETPAQVLASIRESRGQPV